MVPFDWTEAPWPWNELGPEIATVVKKVAHMSLGPWHPSAQARQQGKRFYQGKPCPRGHPGKRYTSNCSCVDCVRLGHAVEDRNYRLAYQAYYRARKRAERELSLCQ